MKTDGRSAERLRAHYEVEKRLATQLQTATAQERRSLYSSAYDTLFREVPDHPQLTRKRDEGARMREASRQLRLLRPHLRPDHTFLEIGAGDCTLAAAVAPHVAKVIAVDVSIEIASGHEMPDNVEVIVSDGVSIPVPDEMVDLVYSNQLMEHLHLDDALLQLRNIHGAIRPGGAYLCVTPNRVSGPHDISQYFDEAPTGFHLHEYSTQELAEVFRKAGFDQVTSLIGATGFYIPLPVPLAVAMDTICESLPRKLRARLPGWPLVRALLGIQMIARKQGAR